MTDAPLIRTLGLSGLLVTFARALNPAANRAALALRAAVEAEGWPEVAETTSSLTSVFLRVDLLAGDMAALETRLRALVDSRDWGAAPLPSGRRLWRIPVTLEGTGAPQLDEAAALAGMTAAEARASIAAARVRVLTIGFAPGQPYMGELPEAWNIPRQEGLTAQVPRGALVVAIRQLIIFSGPTPTGWRHIGQTGFHCFRPDAADPFPLAPGDEVTFDVVRPDRLEALKAGDPLGGGATVEALP